MFIPLLAIGISFCVASAAGVGKKRIEAIFRLAGFASDRNSFCRGWLITGATGSGKTASAIVTKFHQVFRHEKGTLRDSWEGSDLEVKVEEIEKRYRQETDRIYSKISILREERGKLDEELEVAAQQSLMGDIQYQTMSSEERAEQAESIKSELNLQSDSSLDPATTSIAAVQYQKLLQRAKGIEEEIGRIEWRELHPIKQQFDDLMKRIELAKYKSFPWGGLCIDEKGLFWQTLVPIARHYNREHHLMLLQNSPGLGAGGMESPGKIQCSVRSKN